MASLSTGRFKLSVFSCCLVTSAYYVWLMYFVENQPPATVTAQEARPSENPPVGPLCSRLGTIKEMLSDAHRKAPLGPGNLGCFEVAGRQPKTLIRSNWLLDTVNLQALNPSWAISRSPVHLPSPPNQCWSHSSLWSVVSKWLVFKSSIAADVWVARAGQRQCPGRDSKSASPQQHTYFLSSSWAV